MENKSLYYKKVSIEDAKSLGKTFVKSFLLGIDILGGFVDINYEMHKETSYRSKGLPVPKYKSHTIGGYGISTAADEIKKYASKEGTEEYGLGKSLILTALGGAAFATGFMCGFIPNIFTSGIPALSSALVDSIYNTRNLVKGLRPNQGLEALASN